MTVEMVAVAPEWAADFQGKESMPPVAPPRRRALRHAPGAHGDALARILRQQSQQKPQQEQEKPVARQFSSSI